MGDLHEHVRAEKLAVQILAPGVVLVVRTWCGSTSRRSRWNAPGPSAAASAARLLLLIRAHRAAASLLAAAGDRARPGAIPSTMWPKRRRSTLSRFIVARCAETSMNFVSRGMSKSSLPRAAPPTSSSGTGHTCPRSSASAAGERGTVKPAWSTGPVQAFFLFEGPPTPGRRRPRTPPLRRAAASSAEGGTAGSAPRDRPTPFVDGFSLDSPDCSAAEQQTRLREARGSSSVVPSLLRAFASRALPAATYLAKGAKSA